MASSVSGATGTLTIGSTELSGEDAVTAFDLTPNEPSADLTTGGMSLSFYGGSRSWSGSFSCAETENTNSVLLGQNGTRVALEYTAGSYTPLDATCVIQVTRAFDDRGLRRYEVSFTVDGSPT